MFEALGFYSDSFDMREEALKKHEHKWTEATCGKASYCEECGAEGTPALEHSWVAATCTNPKKCVICGVTEGNELGHEWLRATCTEPSTCIHCGKTTDSHWNTTIRRQPALI